MTDAERTIPYSQSPPPSDIVQNFGQLLESLEESDVEFEVEGEIFAAHKLVIAARSPVFKAQLFGAFKDQNTKCIRVEDMKAPVFKALLHYLYWYVFPDVEESFSLNSKWAKTMMS
ncbi:BTB/POZ and MATH domain-containing protein 2 [Abeliophyllum distichum]|uniref:BTB/POZ and MATH domain-containing protein 2 n=1 Tax=Abeliophyllum distichum TaxID=126358 RepID=A0ABD1T1Z1_9LAMI